MVYSKCYITFASTLQLDFRGRMIKCVDFPTAWAILEMISLEMIWKYNCLLAS